MFQGFRVICCHRKDAIQIKKPMRNDVATKDAVVRVKSTTYYSFGRFREGERADTGS